ncbi:CDP-alcohol phosphatidyltransferase family protein [Lujinxingia litoralis]|nr:CDP-alcohol phosphatidyltransferase family protein [Lujinxingia litoralis]
MTILAITDLTSLPEALSPTTPIAGLSLVDRIARMCLVSGVDTCIFLTAPSTAPIVDDAITAATRARGEVRAIAPETLPAAIDDLHPEAVLVLPANRVFQRAVIQDALKVAVGPGSSPRPDLAPHQVLSLRAPEPDALLQALARPSATPSDADAHTPAGWSVALRSLSDVARAEARLFNDCRKPQDGIVSRHLNRHLSLAMSRRLVGTWVGPNHISAITLSLGFAAAIAAGFGGYTGFLIAGVLYQLNSVIDGVDGELARVRYEFSVLGEWLDTVSDDLSDLLLYLGLGVGAWRTMATGLGPLGPEIWLYLGLAAAGGKLASMVVYYRWLIARGRGDLLAFEWSFKDQGTPQSPLKRALSVLHYAFRKDFIVFVAMILAFIGTLPYLLVALAPGNVIVALSVVLQQLRGPGTGRD